MSDQTYNVKYNIEVESTEAVTQLGNFTTAVEKLAGFKADMSTAIANINKAMQALDKAFKADKDGKKRNYNYTFNIDTKSGQGKLDRILSTINSIEAKAKGIKLVVNPGKAFNSKGVEANAKQIIEHSRKVFGNIAGATHTTQTTLTRSVGKINSALTHLERGREINIKTDAAKARLNEILSLLGQVRTAAGKAMNLGVAARNIRAKASPATPNHTFVLPPNAQMQLSQAGLIPQTPVAATSKPIDPNKALAAQQKLLQRQNADIVKGLIRSNNQTFSAYNTRQKAAINRLQYSRPPSLRNALPFAYMLNGYMLLSTLKSQMTQAVEYANIMESAHSILKVADRDLGSFENRFNAMAKNVRTVGIETKFTAVQVAGAVKYLAMAGQNIDTINKSIRPITNLALIGDNDVAQIADLTTNIMAGYDIDPNSMPAVADIIASTVSRSNVNILETAESYKMAAGYLRMAGIDFSESAAAIGLLGNVGVKGTMAGTSLRAIAIRLAHQPKEAREILDKLGVKFTHYVDVYGEQIEKIRPLADIFDDLKKKGATLGDMSKIFGRWGANAGMALMLNSDNLRGLTAQNRASHGISTTFAQVKQQTTKGLWHQMTSMFTESFMRGYEILEPKIQMLLRKFTASFNTDRFAEGLAKVATAILDLLNLLGKVATWFVNNYKWIEPILFTGFVATRLFKLAGAVTNLAVAMGFLGKQSAAASGLQVLSALTGGIGVKGLSGALSFGAKRSLVTALRTAGVTGGKGVLTAALAGAGIGKGVSLLGRGAASGLFATQVATGKGLVGAGAAIAGIGTGAVAAVAGIAGLVGALGYVAYKTWKIKEAKDAVMEDLTKKEVYVYPCFDALEKKLDEVYDKAIAAQGAVNNVREGKLKDITGQAPGMFTGNWWKGLGGSILWALSARYGADITNFYTTAHAYQDDLKNSIVTLARYDGVETANAMYGELGKLKSLEEVNAFWENIPYLYGQRGEVDEGLYSVYSNNDSTRLFKTGLKNMSVDQAVHTLEYQRHINWEVLPKMAEIVKNYGEIISSPEKALDHVLGKSLTREKLNELGLFQGEDGRWTMKPLAENATSEEKTEYLTKDRHLKYLLGTRVQALREAWGQDGAIAANLMEKAGFDPSIFSNEPLQQDKAPWNAPGITVTGADDDDAGGNYSGTGKLSSAAPKQVIVNITNLLSIQTIELLKSTEGKQAEIQNLKEQMAQALVDVVHDFDASWNGA